MFGDLQETWECWNIKPGYSFREEKVRGGSYDEKVNNTIGISELVFRCKNPKVMVMEGSLEIGPAALFYP